MLEKKNISTLKKLSDGNRIPLLGLGVWATKPGKESYKSVSHALKKGYRLIDTAEMYDNEKDIGSAIIDSGIAREEIFVTTKLWDSTKGYDHTLKAFNVSLKKMNLEYIDLYLIHWPGKGSHLETWRALERIKNEGRCISIGVSNFAPHHLKEILEGSHEKPVVNQIEISPFLHQREISNFCLSNNIHITAYCPLARAKRFNNIKILKIAKETSKTPAQVMLRWSIQKGFSVIPKSSVPERIEENSNIFDFSLNKEQMDEIGRLNEGLRFCPDPLKI